MKHDIMTRFPYPDLSVSLELQLFIEVSDLDVFHVFELYEIAPSSLLFILTLLSRSQTSKEGCQINRLCTLKCKSKSMFFLPLTHRSFDPPVAMTYGWVGCQSKEVASPVCAAILKRAFIATCIL